MAEQVAAILDDPAELVLAFRHEHGLLDPASIGVHHWDVRVTTRSGGKEIGRVLASRGLFWEVGNLHARLADESEFLAEVSRELLMPNGSYSARFEEAVEMPTGDVLVIEALTLEAPYGDALVAAALVASLIDRLAGGCCAIVLPRTTPASPAGAVLLDRAGTLLGADEFSERLHLVDPAFVTFSEAAQRVRERLLSRSLTGSEGGRWEDDDTVLADDGTEDYDDDYDEDGWALTSRTAAVLRLALDGLSRRAWEEVAALEDEPLAPAAAGLFAQLPPVTFPQPRIWRRQMARSFDDLAADLAASKVPNPRCTAEEMALHLAIRHAKKLTRDRPNLVADAVGELPRQADDFDWDGCSEELFEDHDVLMLYDRGLDGIEDSGGEVNQALGMVNLAPCDWFEPFGEGRDPGRGFRND